MNNWEEFCAWENSSRDTIDVKRCYIDIAGDLVSGILLSQIIYWFLPTNEGSKLRVVKDGEYWLVKSRVEWWEECRISAKQFDRAIKILKDKNLVITKRFRYKGSPTIHIKLCYETILEGVNCNLTKGKIRNELKVNLQIDKKGKTLTESTTKNTTKNTNSLPNKGEINPVTEVLNGMKAYYGYPDKTNIDPIPNYGKEGKAIKRMLERGFTIPEILEAWMQKVKSAGQFKSMVYVNEDIKVSPAKSTTSNIHFYRKAFYQKYKEEYNHVPTAIEIDQINSWIEEMEKRGVSIDEILNGDPLKMEVPA